MKAGAAGMPLLLALLLLLAAPAHAQAPEGQPAREVVVANETERLMQEIYLFPQNAAEPGSDRLGNAVLPARASLRLPVRSRECAWEVRVVFEDGSDEQRRLDICRPAPRAVFADGGPRRDVAVVNDSDVELRELYLMPSGSAIQGNDRLGTRTVPAGDTLPIRLRGGPECLFDLRAVFADDSEVSRRRVDLCRTPRISFGDPSLPLREALVANRARTPVRELFARPAGTERWGADRLGSAVLEPRGEFRLRIRATDCRYDLRAVFENDREEEHAGLELCAGPQPLPLALTGLPPGVQAEPRRLRLVNAYPRPVVQVYLVPAEPDDWGDDQMNEGELAPGTQQDFTVTAGCGADLRIVFPGDAAEERRNLDLCTLHQVVLRPGWVIAEHPEGEPEAAPARGGEPAQMAPP